MLFSKTEKYASLVTDLKFIFLGFGNFIDLDPGWIRTIHQMLCITRNKLCTECYEIKSISSSFYLTLVYLKCRLAYELFFGAFKQKLNLVQKIL